METDTAKKKFLAFQNNSNICWLDASMSLIAHNKAIESIAKDCPDSKLNQIIKIYNEAMFILNDSNSEDSPEDREQKCRQKLQNIQTDTLQYLQPILKNESGEPDSAFCALLNLFYENKCIKETLSICWAWEKLCSHCGICTRSNPTPKPIITLSKVNVFDPHCPTFIYTCSCKTEQEMRLIYKQVPPCIVFHFEQGAGEGNLPLFFTVQDRKYQLTCAISLEKGKSTSVNHFVTWIRDPFERKWLECNDLSKKTATFSSEQPMFKLKDVYIFVYESFDNVGKITIATTGSHFLEHDSGNCVELIDLSDESGGLETKLENTSTYGKNLNIEKCTSDFRLKDAVYHSDLFSSKDKMCLDFGKPAFTNSENLKIDDEKNPFESNDACVENKEIKIEEKNHSGDSSRDVCIENKEIKRANTNYTYNIKNVKFINKSRLITKEDFLKLSASKFKSSEIKTSTSYHDSLVLGNTSKSTDKEDFLSNNIDISRQKASSEMSFINGNDVEKKSVENVSLSNNIDISRQKASSELFFINTEKNDVLNNQKKEVKEELKTSPIRNSRVRKKGGKEEVIKSLSRSSSCKSSSKGDSCKNHPRSSSCKNLPRSDSSKSPSRSGSSKSPSRGARPKCPSRSGNSKSSSKSDSCKNHPSSSCKKSPSRSGCSKSPSKSGSSKSPSKSGRSKIPSKSGSSKNPTSSSSSKNPTSSSSSKNPRRNISPQKKEGEGRGLVMDDAQKEELDLFINDTIERTFASFVLHVFHKR